ncbi:hypothetical protein CFC21_044215 [Triticum aestivum]|uniref:Uncharacterized protein n=2 Tax=Triticum aestivum TaxID=4565 RepID=A0A9R1FQJ0_WHEAT|nr:hypothetical protein CFC21_044215 [Triticum aestivum]CDM86399.1 unnamed protein product [Triticum aestivum]
MAKIISSAIVGETISQIFSGITNREDEDKSDEATGGGGLERLEMAHIKMEAALEMSDKWQITDVSLLHWRKKLKCAAQECNDVARRCWELSLEEDEAEQVLSKSSFAIRVAHATKAFVSSFIGCEGDHCSGSIAAAIRRFERFADGATEFIQCVQLGGTPRQPLFFDPLIRHIFTGKTLRYMVMHPGGQYQYFGIRPMAFEERGLEAMLSFIYEDFKVPKNSFRLGFMLRLSESTDIIGTTVKCLQLVTPHFKSTADAVIKGIIQLPTQDFSCLPPEAESANMEHWNQIHKTFTGWFRPDPLCCQGYKQEVVPSHVGNCGNKVRLSSIFPEPVCEVFLQRQISLLDYKNLQGSTAGYDFSSLENTPLLKLGILFMPHDSLENPKSTGEGSAIEVIDGEKQHLTHANVHPDQLDEILLPKAIDYLHHNTETATYQIVWRSNHGSAHLCVEKTRTTRIPRARKAATRQGRNKNSKTLRQMKQEQMRKVQWMQVAKDFLKLWVVRSSERLQSTFTSWLKQ